MSRAPRVVVAGGSVGGLTAAHALSDAGCDVVVLERSPAPLAGRYRLAETSIKPYPVVATAVAPVRAAIELHRAGLPPLDEIEKLLVRLPRFALNTPSAAPGRRYPANINSSGQSISR